MFTYLLRLTLGVLTNDEAAILPHIYIFGMDCSMGTTEVQQIKETGGESGIRTHVTLSSKHAFQACAFSHSAISPAPRAAIVLILAVLRTARDLDPSPSVRSGRQTRGLAVVVSFPRAYATAGPGSSRRSSL